MKLQYTMTPTFPRIINDPTFTPVNPGRVLDMGCGRGVLGALLRVFHEPTSITGVDAFYPYIEHCDKLGVYDRLYQLDVSAIGKLPFESQEFDNVYCLSMIEHLAHGDALYLLYEMSRVGKRVVVTTPTRFDPNCELEGNEFQRHRSLVTKRDFESMGYKVRGFRQVRGLPIDSWVLGSLLPSIHQDYIAVKDRRL